MTQQEREEIFAKEVLTAKDISRLFEVSESTSYQIIREIKFKYDRIKVKGIVHVQDYLDYYELPQSRYVFLKEKSPQQETEKVR